MDNYVDAVQDQSKSKVSEITDVIDVLRTHAGVSDSETNEPRGSSKANANKSKKSTETPIHIGELFGWLNSSSPKPGTSGSDPVLSEAQPNRSTEKRPNELSYVDDDMTDLVLGPIQTESPIHIGELIGWLTNGSPTQEAPRAPLKHSPCVQSISPISNHDNTDHSLMMSTDHLTPLENAALDSINHLKSNQSILNDQSMMGNRAVWSIADIQNHLMPMLQHQNPPVGPNTKSQSSSTTICSSTLQLSPQQTMPQIYSSTALPELSGLSSVLSSRHASSSSASVFGRDLPVVMTTQMGAAPNQLLASPVPVGSPRCSSVASTVSAGTVHDMKHSTSSTSQTGATEPQPPLPVRRGRGRPPKNPEAAAAKAAAMKRKADEFDIDMPPARPYRVIPDTERDGEYHVKRDRNNDAVRKSRLKSKLLQDRLVAENTGLKATVAALTLENEQQKATIRNLEQTVLQLQQALKR